jgi:hypothetical protein
VIPIIHSAGVQQTEKKIEDPVARSIAKPDAFAKPAIIGKPGAPTNSKSTRIRTMNWKRGRGRPRKTRPDPRKVKFF